MRTYKPNTFSEACPFCDTTIIRFREIDRRRSQNYRRQIWRCGSEERFIAPNFYFLKNNCTKEKE